MFDFVSSRRWIVIFDNNSKQSWSYAAAWKDFHITIFLYKFVYSTKTRDLVCLFASVNERNKNNFSAVVKTKEICKEDR